MEYRTVYQGGKGEIVEKKSRFIAEVFLVHSEEEAMQYLEQVRKKYWDARGIAASSGSACAVGRHEIPPTLLAMGLEPSIAKSALRMTFRTPLTREQIERISLAIEESYTDLTRY